MLRIERSYSAPHSALPEKRCAHLISQQKRECEPKLNQGTLLEPSVTAYPWKEGHLNKLLQTGDGIFDDGLVALPALTEILRSKNAGSYEITFDIVFRNLTCHERAQKPGKLTKERIAKLYNIKPENVVARQFFRQAEASKCTIPRGGIAGSFGDRDLNASQQYALWLGIRV